MAHESASQQARQSAGSLTSPIAPRSEKIDGPVGQHPSANHSTLADVKAAEEPAWVIKAWRHRRERQYGNIGIAQTQCSPGGNQQVSASSPAHFQIGSDICVCS